MIVKNTPEPDWSTCCQCEVSNFDLPWGSGLCMYHVWSRRTWEPLRDGVPGDMRSGRDNGWIGGGCRYKITNVGSTWEVGDTESIEHIPMNGHMTPTIRCIPIVETSVKWIEVMGMEYNL